MTAAPDGRPHLAQDRSSAGQRDAAGASGAGASGAGASGAGATGGRVGPRPSAWARVKPALRGEPLHVPSHALVVHFPAALLPASLLFDLLDRADPSLGLARAAAALLVVGLLGGVAAAATGLLDWLEMIAGPRRTRVTRHLLVQAAALVAFAISLALRAGDVASPASFACLVASLVGLGLLIVGDHLGGLLVYRDGMRVRTGGR